MAVLPQPIDDATYTALDWVSLVGDMGDIEARWTLVARFFQRAHELEEAGNVLQSLSIRVLGGAISMHIRIPSHAPFGPHFRSQEGRSMSIEDLGEHDVALITRAAHDAPTPWMRARFSDLAVTADGRTPPNWRLGRMAVDAYLDYVTSVFGTEHAIRGLDELQRGLVLLWVYAKRDNSLWDRYWSVILDEVSHSIEQNSPGLVFMLCDEAIRRNRRACEVILPQIETKATSLEQESPLDAAHWHAQAHRLNQKLGKTQKANESLCAQGEAMASAAELAARDQPILAPVYMTEAISLLRRAKATTSRIQALRDQLADYERASLDSYWDDSVEIDVSEGIKWIDEQIDAPDFFSALLRSVFRVRQMLNVDNIEKRVRRNASMYPLSRMFAQTRVNSDGMTISQLPALDLNDPESVRLHMIKEAREFDIKIRSDVLVTHIADTLYSTYQPPFHVIKTIVDASGFTPPDQGESIARGLYAGFIDDWLAAATYLIPVMEPFVRAQLKRHGVHTTVMNEDGTQHEKTLGELLDMPDAACFFGKHLVFELRALLTETEGFNLRNAFCHGLMSDRDLRNAGTLSLWWVLWWMVLFPWCQHPAVLAPPPSNKQPD